MKYYKYKDEYGDIWVRHSNDYVIRCRDRMIGGWFNGNGLIKYCNN